jgi:hypothetical protein
MPGQAVERTIMAMAKRANSTRGVTMTKIPIMAGIISGPITPHTATAITARVTAIATVTGPNTMAIRISAITTTTGTIIGGQAGTRSPHRF